MAASPLVIQDVAGVTVASITNTAMLDSRAIEATGTELYKLADELNHKRVVIDFSDVKFLSSQAIGVVLTMHKKVKDIKGELVICGVRSDIMKVFTITNLHKLLKFYPDENAALKKFGIHAR